MGRPRKDVDVAEVVRLRECGLSWPKIARRMRFGQGTVFRAFQRATRTSGQNSSPGYSVGVALVTAEIHSEIDRRAALPMVGSEESKCER